MARRTSKSGYVWDVFVSYKRNCQCADWTHRHFLPMFEQCLNDAMTREPSIFVDETEIDGGDHWPYRLRDALSRSRCLVPICNPAYFRSMWCVAEYKSMLAREDTIGLSSKMDPSGLIFPVLFTRPARFPSFAKIRQASFDATQWAIPYEVFRDTPKYIDFHTGVNEFAITLADRIDKVPKWQSDWPLEVPEALDDETDPPTGAPKL